MTDGVDKILGGVGEVLESAPKLYDDAIQPTAQETGKTLSLIPRTINAALVPLRKWIATREYNLAETEKLLAYKLEHLDPEKIVSPEPYVAVPALQAISYSMDNEELKNFYANLLAKSMNIDIKDSVHPAFVEIIKQLSPFDAEFLKKLSIQPYDLIPKIKIRFQQSENETKGIDQIRSVISPNIYGFKLYDKYNISLDNLSRLKLVNINDDYRLTDDSHYEDILDICKNINLPDNENYHYIAKIKGTIQVTRFGESFIDTVVEE